MNAPPRRNAAPDARGDRADLLFALPGARAGDQREAAVTDLLPARQLDNRVIRVKLAVRLFVRLLHALDALDDVLRGDVLAVNGGGIAEQAEHGGMRADPGVHGHAVALGEHIDKAVYLFLAAVGF